MKTKIHMIGNTHIDPVWFWAWPEGMQEVKASFVSALDRLDEFPDFIFTVTSSCFFEWIEKLLPDLFARMKDYVDKGRIQIIGGSYVENDTNLPSGEALIRQLLYGQRYFKGRFGKYCDIAANVDAFGQSNALPQILRKSGLDYYIFMRPRLTDTPVFMWEGDDGSQVCCLSLPTEYTTWFYEDMAVSVAECKRLAEDYSWNSMACCYGVGNHGGGPTIANIESIYQIQEEQMDLELYPSSFRNFFDDVARDKLPIRHDFFDRVSTGAYSMMHTIKEMNRNCENSLQFLEYFSVLEHSLLNKTLVSQVEAKKIWKRLLFNQFHDTLCGTLSHSAAKEALHQFHSVQADSLSMQVLSMQAICNHFDTAMEGFPLFVFNPSGQRISDYLDIEIPWFCKDGLIIYDENNREIPYQRSYTEAKSRNYNIGGRRRIVFPVDLEPVSFRVYRLVAGNPTKGSDARIEPEFQLVPNNGFKPNADPYILENSHIRLICSPEGFITSIYDKQSDYEALGSEVQFPIWRDERDAWGGRQFRALHPKGKYLEFECIDLIEACHLRKVIRLSYRYKANRLSMYLTLYHDKPYVEVTLQLFSVGEWESITMAFPNYQRNRVCASKAYGTYEHKPEIGVDYCMHKYVDLLDEDGRGLYIANSNKYAYRLSTLGLEIILSRNAIVGQGYGVNWYRNEDAYRYADQGNLEMSFLLLPHGSAMSNYDRECWAVLMQKPLTGLLDSVHSGMAPLNWYYSWIKLSSKHVLLEQIKLAEDGCGMILRLRETDGIQGELKLKILDYEFHVLLKPYELSTWRFFNGCLVSQNLLEEVEGSY